MCECLNMFCISFFLGYFQVESLLHLTHSLRHFFHHRTVSVFLFFVAISPEKSLFQFSGPENALLSRILQVYPSRTPIHFLQESCRSGIYQTLSARILQVPYISDKLVRFWQIRHFLQIQTFLARFLDKSCKTMSES